MLLHPAALSFTDVRVVTVTTTTRTPVLLRLASPPADVPALTHSPHGCTLVRTTCPIFTFFPFMFPARLLSRLPSSSSPLPPFHPYLPLSALLPLPLSLLFAPSATPVLHPTSLLILLFILRPLLPWHHQVCHCPYQKSQGRKFVCLLVVVGAKGVGNAGWKPKWAAVGKNIK